jgi:type I restriction enzyme S subunit
MEGELPHGWRQTSVYNVASVKYGAAFASKHFNNARSGRPLVRIRDLPSHGSDIFTDEVHPKEHVIRAGDIVVGMDGEFRAYVWQGLDSLMNQRVCSFIPRQPHLRAFTLLSIKPLLASMERGAVGTTVIHLGKKDIDRFEVVDPGAPLVAAYGALVEPLLDRLVLSGSENRTLAETRDYLRPRLMSGEVAVREALQEIAA